MALTEIYVDPSIAGDSGAGTIGDPYGDLEYAIEQETFDTTNGTRINIKAGTDEVLAAALNTALADTTVSVAWVPSGTAPLVFQGYSVTAGDGGIGGISGGGAVGIITGATYNNVHFINIHAHNTGAATVIDLNDYCSVQGSKIGNTTGGGAFLDTAGSIVDCYFYNLGNFHAATISGFIANNYFDCSAGSPVAVIAGSGGVQRIERNIIDSYNGTNYAIALRSGSSCDHNSIFSAGGTGTGIQADTTSQCFSSISNNLIEGFSGAGGIGIDLSSAGTMVNSYRGNSVYNCTTAYSAAAVISVVADSNETLSASPFTDAANGDFSPVETGLIKEGALPSRIGGGFI